MHIALENMLQLFIVDTLLSRQRCNSYYTPQVKKKLKVNVKSLLVTSPENDTLNEDENQGEIIKAGLKIPL